MIKQRVWRTPLVAVLGLLAFLVVPAAAQAHHVDTKAECQLVGNVPTVRFTADFVQFSSTKDVSGKVWLGTDAKLDGKPAITWTGDNGRWTYEQPGVAGQVHVFDSYWSWPGGKDDEPEKSTEPCPEPKQPGIALEKTGAATAAAGSTFTYTFTATNTGDVTLVDVQLTDPKCQSTLTRVEPNLGDPTFDVGDQWFYTCTVVAPAGPAQVDNTAEVCADYPADTAPPVCDEDTHTFTVPPPSSGNPPENPPSPVTPDSTPSGTPPDSEVLPETILSGRARLRGPSGCVKQAFRARVRGRSIASVTFFVDGRRVKTVRAGNAFALKVNPARYGFGRHKVVALVRFRAESGTQARRLPLTFRRCAQGAVAPRFTG